MGVLHSYQIVRSKKRRKTISLHIKEDGKIVVYAPYQTLKREIEQFVEKNRSWVSRKLLERENSIREAKGALLPGEKLLYLGELYPLEIEDNNNKGYPIKLSFSKFILNKKYIEEAKDLMIQWYKKEAKEKLAERIEYYSNALQLFPQGMKITGAKHRWGSCSGDNRLSFSWRLVMTPLSIIDYILIHELVHIKEKNHSKRFWSHLESILPDYRERRRWLKKHEGLLQL